MMPGSKVWLLETWSSSKRRGRASCSLTHLGALSGGGITQPVLASAWRLPFPVARGPFLGKGRSRSHLEVLGPRTKVNSV